MRLPNARTENIVDRKVGKELLIYDLLTDRAFCLNETSAKVFSACNGTTTFAELKAEHELTDGIIYLALDGLQKQNLLAGDYDSPFAGINRREVIRKVGLATMIALPAISSLVAPSAASAASASGTCSPGLDRSDFIRGSLGQGGLCNCSMNGSFPPCNTTRGSIDTDGCKSGCICRTTDPATQCDSSNNCVGVCS